MKFILSKIFEDKSISKVFLLSLLLISLSLILILGIFTIQQEKQKFTRESALIQEDFIKNQKKTLLQETQTLINFIENERLQTRNLLKKEISSRVNEAHTIATNLYKSYKNKLSDKELENLILNALASLRFNNGSGYFYINSLSGIVIQDPQNPEWKGKNKLALKDAYGVSIIKSEIETATTTGEGYTNYSWQDNNSQKIHPQISFVKIFKPFNWYIGCTQHVENYKTEIQEDILNKITDLRFDDNFTIAVIRFDGVCLAHTNKSLIGKNLWDSEDKNQNKFIQKFISRGTDMNGGFVESLNNFDNHSSLANLMHAKAYKDWQWVIGSGVNLKELNLAINKRKQELRSNVNNYIIRASIVLILSIFFIIIFTRFVVKISKSELGIFSQFYKDAASNSVLIDTSTLHFKEFKELGDLANQMIINRQKAEHQLNIETAYFEQLFENSPEAIAITNTESKGIKINHKFTELFGYSAKDIKGAVVDSLLTDKDTQNEACELNATMAKGKLAELETKRKCKNGELIDVSIMGNPIVIDGKTIAIFGIYRDITQRKEYEQHLKEAKHRAEESDLLKSAFLANMSHEIRTPMNHIIGFTDIMTSQQIEEKDRQEYAALIKQSGYSLLQLINNIIDLSKIESKQVQIHPEYSCVNSILTTLYERFNKQKNENKKSHLNLIIEKPLSNNDSIIYTDARRLEQLLANLIDNAIKFTNKGNIEFGYQLNKAESEIELYVKDTGIGIPKKYINNIFKSFRQIDGSDTRQYSGTGLGLTISHRLSEILGGKIRLKSEENKGTCFYVSLPYKCKTSNLTTKISEEYQN
ncbi:cache domain-containing protein [Marinifilum sp. RC60d5]|uniref:cache domain-containing protein n=1 Tax=Marinifilum sp. RC60d5 TaxID=3458414 RepID=UPI0040370E7E